MLNIRAGAPASVAAACALLATTATVGLVFTGTPGEAIGAFGLAVACAHACANRRAAQVALNAYKGTARIAWETTALVVEMSTKAALAERKIEALKAELAALPGHFEAVPEVANDGR